MNTIYTPVESSEFPGYYLIPGIKNYIINEYGIVRQLFESKYKKYGDIITSSSVGKLKYLRNRLLLKYGKYKKYANHRLVCLAFYGLPGPGQTDVNHKDGIRYNNYFKNLEWCTSSQNRQHAYDNGMHPGPGTSKPILVWDTVNDPKGFHIRYFNSKYSFNKLFNNKIIRGGIYDKHIANGTLYLNRFILKYADDLTAWPNLSELHSTGWNRLISAYNVNTKVVYYRENLNTLSTCVNMHISGIRAALSRNKPFTIKGWIFSTELNPDWKSLTEQYYEVFPDVVLYNTLTNTRYIYNNCKDLASINKIPLGCVYTALRIKRYQYKHYLIYYLNDTTDKLTTLLKNYI